MGQRMRRLPSRKGCTASKWAGPISIRTGRLMPMPASPALLEFKVNILKLNIRIYIQAERRARKGRVFPQGSVRRGGGSAMPDYADRALEVKFYGIHASPGGGQEPDPAIDPCTFFGLAC